MRKPKPHGAVVEWVRSVAIDRLHVSAVTLGEIQPGVELTREQDVVKAERLGLWLKRVTLSYNVIPMDAACFTVWARMVHRQSNTLYEDAMIAATARVHDLTVATRNVRDFKAFDVPVLNPFLIPSH